LAACTDRPQAHTNAETCNKKMEATLRFLLTLFGTKSIPSLAATIVLQFQSLLQGRTGMATKKAAKKTAKKSAAKKK
jgi:hypothetical protein